MAQNGFLHILVGLYTLDIVLLLGAPMRDTIVSTVIPHLDSLELPI